MHTNCVAISDCDHLNIDEEQSVFRENGVSWELLQCQTEDDLIRALPGYPAVINQYAPFTERVFAALPDLRFVVRYGVGVNNIDLEAASRHGVAVCNVPDYGVQEVAGHAFAMALALTRKLIPMDRSVRAGRWEYAESVPIRRLRRLTYGVVGIGRIGSCFAELCSALDGRVIAYDLHAPLPHPDCVELVDFETLLRESDVISIHCNLESARGLFSMETLRRMKPSAYLINVSRGGIVVEEDLAEALDQGVIAGAGIDVTAVEPLPADSPLLHCKNLILTPHMAWYSEEASSDLKTKAAEEACRYLCGEKLRNRLNR